jgi:hypothetical protein
MIRIIVEYNKPRTGKKKKRWSVKYKKSINCSNPKGFSQKAYCKRKKRGGGYKNEQIEEPLEEIIRKVGDKYCLYSKKKNRKTGKRRKLGCKTTKKAIRQREREVQYFKHMGEKKEPAKGTGKKPKGSSRRLYTDENPKDTVPVKFKTVSDIRDTLSRSDFKSKDHARQSQIINLIHQRVRAAYRNAKNPETKKRLKKAYDYATKRKEASKKKTQRLKKKK